MTTPAMLRVWRVVDLGPDAAARGRALLTDHERDRAAAFRHAGARDRYIVTRATLRRILGDACDLEPAAVRLTTIGRGKPVLDTPGAAAVRFSVAHTDGLALIAVADDVEVGVDVEHAPEEDDVAALVRRVCTEREQGALAALEAHERVVAFYRLWTRKEAVAKADGRGVAIGFESLDVLDVGAPGEADAGSRVGPWWVRDLDVGAGHVAAVAAGAPIGPVRWFTVGSDAAGGPA